MGKGEWEMGNEQQVTMNEEQKKGMVNEEWGMKNGEWRTGHEEQGTGNGERGMVRGKVKFETQKENVTLIYVAWDCLNHLKSSSHSQREQK